MHAELVDEYRLMVHPIVMGAGKRIFRDPGDTKKPRLIGTEAFGTEAFGTGIVVLTYQPEQSA
jgi:dihydrofolate reductase